jgi:hypothetical protein
MAAVNTAAIIKTIHPAAPRAGLNEHIAASLID